MSKLRIIIEFDETDLPDTVHLDKLAELYQQNSVLYLEDIKSSHVLRIEEGDLTVVTIRLDKAEYSEEILEQLSSE